jgi:glycosyltransferase involved in cell wall biosynthesis
MVYHNITPSHWFAGYNPQAESETRFAREVLGRFAPMTDVGLGVSPYNEQELRDVGFQRTGVLPILMDQDALTEGYNRSLVNRLRDGSINWLFVGRIAPNKCQHDVISSFAAYHRRINSRSRLTIVGSPNMATIYLDAMKDQVRRLGVAGRVDFAGHVDRADLLAHYRAADVFVCMSEHEGFCVPLIEAMRLGVPIVAHAAAAVPVTLGSAGILIKRKVPTIVAEVVHQIVTDDRLRERLTTHGRARAADFSRDRVEAELARWLSVTAPGVLEVNG